MNVTNFALTDARHILRRHVNNLNWYWKSYIGSVKRYLLMAWGKRMSRIKKVLLSVDGWFSRNAGYRLHDWPSHNLQLGADQYISQSEEFSLSAYAYAVNPVPTDFHSKGNPFRKFRNITVKKANRLSNAAKNAPNRNKVLTKDKKKTDLLNEQQRAVRAKEESRLC